MKQTRAEEFEFTSQLNFIMAMYVVEQYIHAFFPVLFSQPHAHTPIVFHHQRQFVHFWIVRMATMKPKQTRLHTHRYNETPRNNRNNQ